MISSACVSNGNTIISENTSHAVSKAFGKYTENSVLEQAAYKVSNLDSYISSQKGNIV